MTQTLIKLLFLFSFMLLFVSDSGATMIENRRYYTASADVDLNYKVDTECQSVSCGPLETECWNSWAPYKTDCGTACKVGDTTPKTWTKYGFSLSECRKNIDATARFGELVCTPIYIGSGNTYSTGDKYNSSNPPVLDFGTCTGNVGNPYKTCCSGTTPVGANHWQDDPYPPDEGGCGNNTTVTCQQPSCISGTSCVNPGVACGQAACSQLGTPPPTTTTCPNNPTSMPCTNPTCPTGYIYASDSTGHKVCFNTSTNQIDCNVQPSCPSTNCPNKNGWTGEQCTCGSGNVPSQCTGDPSCKTCSLKYCLSYSGATNTCCYFTNNTCGSYAECSQLQCSVNKCVPGSTRTTCSAPNVCSAP